MNQDRAPSTPSTRRLRDVVRACLRDGCSTQATKAKPKPAPKKKKSVLKQLAAPAPTIKGCVVYDGGFVRDVATGQVRGRISIASGRLVAFLAHIKSKMADQFGAVIDMKDLGLKPEPTLDDIAAFLRPGKKLHVGKDIFKQDKSLKPLAGEDGVKWWGWIVQNKRAGAEHKWVFVAVQEVEQ